jgi:hypothetical protein
LLPSTRCSFAVRLGEIGTKVSAVVVKSLACSVLVPPSPPGTLDQLLKISFRLSLAFFFFSLSLVSRPSDGQRQRPGRRRIARTSNVVIGKTPRVRPRDSSAAGDGPAGGRYDCPLQ